MKPSLPQGTRDFTPEIFRRRQYILHIIQDVFELYGFQPLETPAIENLETLTGKYGDEGDKLIFKILNNGLNDPKNHDKAIKAFDNILKGKNDKNLTERALRYDLTIPLARFIAMNHGQLTFPFKRYQIQPVWRADRPQKGRYREFYQCDADVVGSYSLWNEIEFIHIYNEVFQRLKLYNCDLRINSRKILTALAEITCGIDKLLDITIAIDKLDKIGIEKVTEELKVKGMDDEQIKIIQNYLQLNGSNSEKLNAIKELFAQSVTGKKGIEEIEFLLMHCSRDLKINITVDFTLARGLNYYTGTIFEVKAPSKVSMGSISGGGRYDDLTGLFGVPGLPGAGISFGIDRIYDVLDELSLFNEDYETGTKVLFFNMGEKESNAVYPILLELRSKNIAAEIFHEATKLDKQFKYAEKKRIPFVVIIGSKEIESKNCKIKDLRTGIQKTVSLQNLSDFLFI